MINQDLPVCSVIVLNYFGEKILEKNINSLLKLSYPEKKYEIIIVDNNSKDKSKKIILDYEKKHKNIKTVILKKNLGFAKGNNTGINIAVGKYVVLLNNDCIVKKDWLKNLVKTAEKSSDIFAVNSKIILYNTNKIQNAGIMVFQDGYGRDIGANIKYHSQDYEIDKEQYAKERDIYAACGAASLFRMSILKKIGYFDDDFFMYYEDVEISERARLHGYRIRYCPSAIVYHHHAFSSIEGSPKFTYNAEKGRLLHIFYNFPFTVFLFEYWLFSLSAAVRLIKEIYLIKKISNNMQHIFVSAYFFSSFPRLAFKKIAKNTGIPKDAIQRNYQVILSGDWYFQ